MGRKSSGLEEDMNLKEREGEMEKPDKPLDDSRIDSVIAEQIKRQRKARIIIASGRDSNERAPVPVAVNGREFLIERDTEVEVPECVYEVLRQASMRVAESQPSGIQTSTNFHPAARFNLSFLGWAEEAA